MRGETAKILISTSLCTFKCTFECPLQIKGYGAVIVGYPSVMIMTIEATWRTQKCTSTLQWRELRAFIAFTFSKNEIAELGSAGRERGGGSFTGGNTGCYLVPCNAQTTG